MKLELFPYQLKFKHPFKIAHTVRKHTDCLYIALHSEGKIGLGESVFPPYVNENISSAISFLKSISLPKSFNNIEEIEIFTNQLIRDFPQSIFAIGGLNIALLDLLSERTNKSIGELFNIPKAIKATSFTIGMCEKEEMRIKLDEFNFATYFKLKVDEENIERIIANYMDFTSKPFAIDANQGFKNKDQALYWCDKLHELNVPYVEQPFNKGDLDSHRWLKERSRVPIIADESFQLPQDLERAQNCFDGINVKLMKSGGLSNSVNSLLEAKKAGLITMLGCMSESIVSVSHAYEIAGLADYTDLDGPHLINNNPPFQKDLKKETLNFLKSTK